MGLQHPGPSLPHLLPASHSGTPHSDSWGEVRRESGRCRARAPTEHQKTLLCLLPFPNPRYIIWQVRGLSEAPFLLEPPPWPSLNLYRWFRVRSCMSVYHAKVHKNGVAVLLLFSCHWEGRNTLADMVRSFSVLEALKKSKSLRVSKSRLTFLS